MALENPFKSLSMQVNNPPLERNRNCKTHGEFVAKCFIGEKWYTNCPKCEDEAKAEEQKRQADAAKAERDAAWEKRLGAAGIPLRFRDRTIPCFVAETDEQKYALNFAVNYCAEFEHGHSGRCAVFIGEPGTGKTHLACGIALRAMKNWGASAVFSTVSKIARRVREAKSFNSDETESEAIAVFVYPDLLIVDEVGIQSGTDSEARALFDILNDRYEQRKPTIFLSNMAIPGVVEALGARVFDRMREGGGEVVAFNWGSYRGKQA
jgi:DNA replication protein DnaC